MGCISRTFCASILSFWTPCARETWTTCLAKFNDQSCYDTLLRTGVMKYTMRRNFRRMCNCTRCSRLQHSGTWHLSRNWKGQETKFTYRRQWKRDPWELGIGLVKIYENWHSQAKVINSTLWNFWNSSAETLNWCLFHIISTISSIFCFAELTDLVNKLINYELCICDLETNKMFPTLLGLKFSLRH